MKSACPLDCYDACSVEYVDGVIKASNDIYTQGFLCPHLNHYDTHQRIEKPRYKGVEISMDEAMAKLEEILKQSSNTLHYRSSANMGLMQEVSDHFFAQKGATLLQGSLCDGAGQAALQEGRGSNIIISPQEIEKSEVVIIWGRNVHVTNSHILPKLKDKTVIVIDPVKTAMAENADYFIQIKPQGDVFLAMMLTRFLLIDNAEDREFCDNHASELDEYYELTQTIRIRAILEKIDVTLGDIGKVLDLVKGKKTAILVGVGVQKYSNGADVVRAIDGFGVALGLHAKEGCGVNFLGNSKHAITLPFKNETKKRVTVANVDFAKFDTVFIQGANPIAQLPDTKRVLESFKSLTHSVYFGLYENESSELCDLILPAKNFLEKNDIRASYGHHALLSMPQLKKSDIGISEYALTSKLCKAFDIEIESEESYINHFVSFGEEKDELLHVKDRDASVYADGFHTDDEEFAFLEEYESDILHQDEDEFFLLTCKSAHSLNSQFNRDNSVYVHPSLNFSEDECITLYSDNGEVSLHVKNDERLRRDSILIHSGAKGVNNLTSSKLSLEGKNAIYQENRVRIKR